MISENDKGATVDPHGTVADFDTSALICPLCNGTPRYMFSKGKYAMLCNCTSFAVPESRALLGLHVVGGSSEFSKNVLKIHLLRKWVGRVTEKIQSGQARPAGVESIYAKDGRKVIQ
jgi:hypothetical protein